MESLRVGTCADCAGASPQGQGEERSERRQGRKLWKQKGTGRGVLGSIRSPLWRHGGTVHGPKPRDYSYALPNEMLWRAALGALGKLAEQKLTVVDCVGSGDAQDQIPLLAVWAS